MPIQMLVRLSCRNCGVFADEPGALFGGSCQVALTFHHGTFILPAGWHTSHGEQYCSVACYCAPVPSGQPVAPQSNPLRCACGEAVYRREPLSYTRLPPGWHMRSISNPLVEAAFSCPKCTVDITEMLASAV